MSFSNYRPVKMDVMLSHIANLSRQNTVLDLIPYNIITSLSNDVTNLYDLITVT